MKKYDFKKTEKKWQKKWLEEGIYEPDFAPRNSRSKKPRGKTRPPFYNLMMFPYPSAEGLHIGATRTYTGVDIFGRLKRMQGFDVFEPIGLDGFGIHSENFALKVGKHPAEHARVSEKNFYRQLASIGNGFAWDERAETYDPEYYRWTQWIFLKLFDAGLAYRKKQAVNWCPSCKTVLADEQVEAGKCERCGTVVIKKDLEQWFLKTTAYAGKLLENLDKLDWPEEIKIAQRNWIGRSEGALIRFAVKGADIEVFTTRPDTLFGATYLVLAPEHTMLANGKLSIANHEEVGAYVEAAKRKSQEERVAEGGIKTGVELKGFFAINPASKEKIPVWVADYVLGGYGTGAIMAVPAHDERDYEFAKKYGLLIRPVIVPTIYSTFEDEEDGYLKITHPDITERLLKYVHRHGPILSAGHLVCSSEFDRSKSEEAKWKITEAVGGRRMTQYRLRDWLISRQRYWGPPIPLVFCEACKKRAENPKPNPPAGRAGTQNPKFTRGEIENPGWIAVPEGDLPVKLPFVKNFRPTGTGVSPLASVKSFYEVKCPKCGGKARRETDVSDTFLDSAWYYLGYLLRATNDKRQATMQSPFLSPVFQKWLPVDMYIGGAEHAVLHLLYVRFLSLALRDLGLLKSKKKGGAPAGEPFPMFRTHGLITKDGAKMSKSKGNVINPDEYIEKFGADVMRMYLAFLAPLDQGGDFRDDGILGLERFLAGVWAYFSEGGFAKKTEGGLRSRVHRAVKKVGEDIAALKYNTAISELMILKNEVGMHAAEVVSRPALARKEAEMFIKLLAPLAPFMAEEIWRGALEYKSSVHQGPWPTYDPRLIEEKTFTLVIQVNGKARASVEAGRGMDEAQARELALSHDKIREMMGGKAPRRVIYVPGRLINIVL